MMANLLQPATLPSFLAPPFTIQKHKMESEAPMRMKPTPRSEHPLPDAHDHACPHCGHTCIYFAEQPTHKCALCLHIHTVTTEDIQAQYIHSPGGPDDVQPLDEEALACIIVAECHAYSFRNRVALGCYSLRDHREVYSRRDNFGHLTLLFNYHDSVPYEISVDYDLWEDLFLLAWRDEGVNSTRLLPNWDDRSRKRDDAA